MKGLFGALLAKGDTTKQSSSGEQNADEMRDMRQRFGSPLQGEAPGKGAGEDMRGMSEKGDGDAPCLRRVLLLLS